MGELEKENKKARQRNLIQHSVLAAIAASGLIAVSALAPNAVSVLKSFGIDEMIDKKFNKDRRTIYFARRRLMRKGLIMCDDGLLRLSTEGERMLRFMKLKNFHNSKPKKWDKKWRLLVFDIKESKREIRDHLRRTLNFIGFERLQNSVWIYPYPCEDLIVLLKADFKIGKELVYMIVDNVEYDKNLKEIFGLK